MTIISVRSTDLCGPPVWPGTPAALKGLHIIRRNIFILIPLVDGVNSPQHGATTVDPNLTMHRDPSCLPRGHAGNPGARTRFQAGGGFICTNLLTMKSNRNDKRQIHHLYRLISYNRIDHNVHTRYSYTYTCKYIRIVYRHDIHIQMCASKCVYICTHV